VKELHAEYGHDPADDLDYDDTDHDRHSAAIDGGQHLASDDGVDGAVADLRFCQ
jgi:hypothetical protein